ncbi:lipid A deacylase LpxR family protein [Chitinophagaceae bacterium MMS25-I14]
MHFYADGQAVDNTTLARSMHDSSCLRIYYENDYFTATDYYYTQGIHLEVINPVFRKNPLSGLLIKPRNAIIQYGLALEHNAYTPVDYTQEAIQYNDRPFAAALFLQSFAIATRNNDRITTLLNTGVIGPAAGGNEMQTSIHKWTNNRKPYGWHNQVANDAVLNYEIRYERKLLAINNLFCLSADGMARAGTLSDKATLGTTLMAGILDVPFRGSFTKGRKFQLYGYIHPEIQAIGYDATLEGGLFNRTSLYNVSSGDVNRFVFRNNFGFVFRCHFLYLEYFQSYTTREFRQGNDHHNGGVQMGIAF